MINIRNQVASWWSQLTGQGGQGDHSGSPVVVVRPDKTPQEISELLRHAPLMRTSCEIMAEDITRAWREHGRAATRWTDLEEQFEFRDVVEKVIFYSEGFGGAFILPRFAEAVVPAKALAKPYKVPRAGFLGFSIYAPHELQVASGTDGEKQPNGLPVYYSLRGLPNVKIHHSWVRPFRGPTSPPAGVITTGGFGLHGMLGQSRVDIIYDDFARMASAYSSLQHILLKGNIDVLQLQGLAEALSRCNTTAEMHAALEKLVTQASLTIAGANTFQPMVIDAEEKLERKAGNHTGAADIAQALLSMFVAATRIPRTRLLGEQSKGLNNSGDADLILHYDRCSSFRERKVTSLLNWMDTIVQPSARTIWTYNPLFELTAAELAELRSKQATTDKAYVEIGIPGITDAIALRLRTSQQYNFVSPETQ